MRILLMISNSNVSARELYTLVLQTRFPGWGVSNMSGLPPNPGAILKSFDAVVYELFAADDPRRYRALLSLWADEVKGLETVRLITHIEGPYREGIVAELESQGIVCVGAPFAPEAITAAFERVAPAPRRARKTTASSAEQPPRDGRPGLGERLRGLFRHGAR